MQFLAHGNMTSHHLYLYPAPSSPIGCVIFGWGEGCLWIIDDRVLLVRVGNVWVIWVWHYVTEWRSPRTMRCWNQRQNNHPHPLERESPRCYWWARTEKATQQFKGRGSPGGCARKFPQGDSRTVSVSFLKQHPPELASPLGLGSVLSNNSWKA